MKVISRYRSPVALAAALVIAAAAGPVLAQTSKDSTAATTTTTATAQHAGSDAAHPAANAAARQQQPSAQDKEAMKLSQEGFNAMRDVRAARIAIFEGHPEAAHDLLAKADSSLQAATKDATTLQGSNGQPNASANGNAGNTGTTNAASAEYVPIDGQITLVDAFVDSPAKKAHIDKANQSIAKGDSKTAMDELKLADVGASFTRVLMPLQQTRDHVDAASKLVSQKKYYEANLALKAAEDGVMIDSVMLTEAPKAQANATTGKPAGNSNAASPATATGKSAG